MATSTKKNKIAFLQRGIHENLGAMYLIAALKNGGHSVELFIESLELDFEGSVASFTPDIICFSVMTGSHHWPYETIEKIKKILPKALIVIGGPHPTFFKEVIENDLVDITCIGEGEGAILDLADAYPNIKNLIKTPNLQVKYKGETFTNTVRDFEDIDSILFPDRESYYKYPILNEAERKLFLTSRGCPYNCSFCFNHTLKKMYKGKGKFIRIRTAENIIEEILEVKDKYVLKSVFFQDDTFILSKEWLKDFLEKYREKVNLPFTCLVRADLTDEDVVRWLKEAGCVGVQFGIECGDEEIRNKVLKKHLTDKQIIEAARLYKKYGIKFKTYNMMGLPNESLESAFKTIELNAKIKSDFPWASLLVPYPNTDIAEMMKKDGTIPPDYSIDNISKTFFDKKAVTKKEKNLLNLQRLFFWSVKFPIIFPLVKRLVKLPPNFIFNSLFYLGHFYNYKSSENLDWITSFKMGLNFAKINFFKKNKK